MVSRRLFPLPALALLVWSCGASRQGPDAIAEAFAGPATLNIRKDLALKSPVVGTVKHGDRLEVLQTRRRFVQVRTKAGAIGWTDSRLLMSPEQMKELQTLADSAKDLPSQGSASVYESLNVHSEPTRVSPSFAQIPENGSIDVVDHKLVPRINAPPPSPLTQKKPTTPLQKKKKREPDSRRIPPPPMPPPPKPPQNWLQLSQAQPLPEGEKEPPDESKPEVKPAPLEDWSLVRMKDGRAGWVLTRMLTMSIPDEVAQYAEGHRITSYFALSDIPGEGGQTKHAWLWTTNTQGGQPFEFDGFRVFTWNTRKKRYETVYRERNLTGYYPVRVTRDRAANSASFSIMIDTEGGRLRKTYAFNGYRVNLLSKEPIAAPLQPGAAGGPAQAGKASEARAPQKPWYSRWTDRIRDLFKR